MSEYGAQNMVTPLTRVMMHRPGADMANADPAVWNYGGSLDATTLGQQHDALTKIVESAGAQVEWLPQERGGLADAVFTHDPSLVTKQGAILLNMGKPLRQAERICHSAYYTQANVPLLGEVTSPGTAEAGDCLWLDDATLAVGRGFRTNQAGIDQLSALLEPLGVSVMAFDLPVYKGEHACLHLMSIISLLAEDLALIYQPLMPASFYQLLQERGFELLAAPEGEFEASNGLNLNVLALAPRHGVMISGFPGTQSLMEAAGCRIETFDGAELCIKCEGGPTCLTRPVLRA
ncbi:MAG: amidinotransferase [Rhizobiales bacterium]|nr:amidinotransferase [Hyphomicrobiales bacterium]